MKVIRNPQGRDYWFYIGPWVSRLSWGVSGTFGWREGDSRFTRFIRRWWSGWHRWADDDDQR